MPHIVQVNDKNFEQEVLRAEGTVLVDFSATWCGPCKQLEPILAEVAKSYGKRVKIVKVDIGKNRAVAIRYKIMSLPLMIVFQNGLPVSQLSGLVPKTRIKKMLDGVL